MRIVVAKSNGFENLKASIEKQLGSYPAVTVIEALDSKLLLRCCTSEGKTNEALVDYNGKNTLTVYEYDDTADMLNLDWDSKYEIEADGLTVHDIIKRDGKYVARPQADSIDYLAGMLMSTLSCGCPVNEIPSTEMSETESFSYLKQSILDQMVSYRNVLTTEFTDHFVKLQSIDQDGEIYSITFAFDGEGNVIAGAPDKEEDWRTTWKLSGRSVYSEGENDSLQSIENMVGLYLTGLDSRAHYKKFVPPVWMTQSA